MIIEKFQHAVQYLQYLLKAKHRKGYGVHSPFSFHLISSVFEEKFSYYNYSQIEHLREKLLADKSIIHVSDYGTGKSGKRSISSIASRSLKKPKHAQLLFRLVNAFNPKLIVELGTSLGLTTAYLASVNSNSRVISLEGCNQIASIARSVHQELGLKNITLLEGNIDDTLPSFLKNETAIDFMFFDANHTKEATLRYFHLCIDKITEKSIFVFDDIHRNNCMQEAWNEIVSHSSVTVSFDLFSFGIVFFNKEFKKQHYIYSF